mmetsp:Transcript_40714/g.45393  ORF Transcript_40714/g.45393 Transcript_40714/m.45393 type:complete len:122 (-) Transcript_40714:354-719(-)
MYTGDKKSLNTSLILQFVCPDYPIQKPHLREGVMLPSASMSALTNPESKLPPRGIIRNATAGLTGASCSCSCWKGTVGLKKVALTKPTATANGDGKSDGRVLYNDSDDDRMGEYSCWGCFC